MRAVISITLLCWMPWGAGCYSEPEKASPECFFDGELNGSLSATYFSEYCCTPGSDEDGNSRCRTRFSEDEVSISELASCVPDSRGGGICDIDCGEGDARCRCVSRRDCQAGEICRVGSSPECEAEGFPVTDGDITARCAFCGPAESDENTN